MEKLELIKAIRLVEDERYQLMAKVAVALYEHDTWITFDSLKSILKDHGFDYSEDQNRGLASSIKAAEEAYRAINEEIRHAIAVTYRNKNGELAFDVEK